MLPNLRSGHTSSFRSVEPLNCTLDRFPEEEENKKKEEIRIVEATINEHTNIYIYIYLYLFGRSNILLPFTLFGLMKAIALLMEVENNVSSIRNEQPALKVKATSVKVIDLLNDLSWMDDAAVANHSDARLVNHSTCKSNQFIIMIIIIISIIIVIISNSPGIRWK